MGKITRESWMFIAKEIINIVEDNRDYGTDAITMDELEEFLTGQGVLEIIEEGSD